MERGDCKDLGWQIVKKMPGLSRNYFCVDCCRVTKNPSLYLEHRRDFHGDSISIHKCDLCVYASKHSQKLARHRRTVHRDLIENIMFSRVSSSESSTRIHLDHETSTTTTSQMSSGEVLSMTDKRTRLSPCKWCAFYTSNKTVLIEHIRQMHPFVQIYECDQCNYTHWIRDRYNRHRRYHTMDYVQCSICEFKTIYKWNLERHMKHHTDNKNMGFRCRKCNFTATTKQSISAHELVHHSDLKETDNVKNVGSLDKLVDGAALAIKEEPKSDDENEEEPETNELNPLDLLQLMWQRRNSFNSNAMSRSQEELLNERMTETTIKYFFCRSCNFRNQIDDKDIIHASDKTLNDSLSTFELPNKTLSHQYRCGYCHQTSCWKHVIERHCRLVHNQSGFIEKFDQEKSAFISMSQRAAKRPYEPSVDDDTPNQRKRVCSENV